MKRILALLLIFVFTLSLSPMLMVQAVPTDIFFFEDSFEEGLPDGYSGKCLWDEENNTCYLQSRESSGDFDRALGDLKADKIKLSATFIIEGIANLQTRFYDGSTLVQQMHWNPKGSGTFLIRKLPSGYTTAATGYPTREVETHFEAEFDFENQTGRCRMTGADGEWSDWFDMPLLTKLTKLTKWNFIYTGDATNPGRLIIKSISASQSVDILTDEEAVTKVESELELGDLSNVSGNLELPTEGLAETRIRWTSDSPYIDGRGNYTAPPTNEPETVTLTAHISRGEIENVTKEFVATVYNRNASKAVKDKDGLYLSYLSKVYRNFELPTTGENGSTISWSSSNTDVIEIDGANAIVSRPASDEEVTLTASITNGGYTTTRDFTANVVAEGTDVEVTGEKIVEKDIFVNDIPENYTTKNVDIKNNALYLYRYDNETQVSLRKSFEPRPENIAYVEMDFVAQGEYGRKVEMQMFGTNGETQEQASLFTTQLRFGKGIYQIAGDSAEYSKVGTGLMPTGERNTLRWEFNMYTKEFDTYLNGTKIGDTVEFDENIIELNNLYFPAILEQEESGIIIYSLETGYREDYGKEIDIDSAEVSIPSEINGDFEVLTEGSNYQSEISWSSNSPNAVYNSGKFLITRPSCEQSDEVIEIIATLSNGGIEKSIVFHPTILREKTVEEALDLAEAELTDVFVKNLNDSLSDVRTNLNMPREWVEGTTISWTSSDEEVITLDGIVERRFFEEDSKTVTLTATIDKNGVSRDKIFNVTLINPGYESIAVSKTTESSSVSGVNLTSFVVDGNERTAWVPKSGDKNAWVQIDLGSIQWINRTNIIFTGETSYILKTSTDGARWQTIAEGINSEVVFAPTQARYIRVELTSHNPDRGISELGVYTLYNDEMCVLLDSLAIDLGDLSDITSDITLPSSTGELKSNITWKSSNTSVVANNGAVTRPKYNTTVTLTATVTKGTKSKSVPFTVNVSGTDGNAPSGGSDGGGGGIGVGNQRPTGSVSNTPAMPTIQQPKTFGDLPVNHWSAKAVEWLSVRNIINGDADGNFYPERNVTRAEFVKMLYSALNIADGDVEFTDVNDNDWFAKAVKALASAGIVKGYDDGSFGPNENISRQDMAVLINRAASFAGISIPTGDIASFNDANDIDDYALQSVNRLAQAGIVNGMDNGTFAPKSTATRAQAAQILYNLLGGKGGAE